MSLSALERLHSGSLSYLCRSAADLRRFRSALEAALHEAQTYPLFPANSEDGRDSLHRVQNRSGAACFALVAS